MIFKCCNKFSADPKADELYYTIIQMLIEIFNRFYNFIDDYMTKITEFSFHVVRDMLLLSLLTLLQRN